MADTITPTTADELRDTLKWAADGAHPLELVSSGSKRVLGRPVEAEAVLDLSRFAGIGLYEPEELVISAGPGTPIEEIEAALAANKQMLPFEPPRFGTLLNGAAGAGTLGGLVGTNLAGPRRIKAGGVRDYVLGVKGISGFGEAFKSGGRVMKNVSGYDVSKLMCGAFGTLAALTEITLKVLPAPEAEVTLAVRGLDARGGVAALNAAASSPFEPSGLAYLPEAAAGRAEHVEGGASAALVRLEGPTVSLAERADGVRAALGGAAEMLEGAASAAVWAAVRDVAALLPGGDAVVWRLSVPPADAPSLVERLEPQAYFLDWAGGLIWLVPKTADVVPAVKSGTAMLMRAPDAMRRAVPVFGVQSAAVIALSRRLKESFDPVRVLNRGRMFDGV